MALKIVLLGKTGHGKSSTGNTILGMEVFEQDASPTSITRMLNTCSTTYEGHSLCVVDTPGTFDTQYNDTNSCHKDAKRACKIMSDLMNGFCHSGVTAFFFVYNITAKFNNEEEKNFDLLEKIVGPESLSKFGFLVFTHGDNFKHDIKKWSGQQTGRLRVWIDKFSGRLLLISNKSDLPDFRSRSREDMISQALVLKGRGQSYTLNDYKKHERSRELLIFNEKFGDLKTRIESKSSMTKGEARKFLTEIKTFKDKINDKKKGTNALNEEINRLDQLEVEVKSKIKPCIIS